MYVLGINAYHGDAAAALIKDGRIVAAVEEERFNRVKHCAGFPTQAVRYCLEVAGIGIEEVAHIGISRDPSAHLHKKILFAAGRAAKQVVPGKAGKRVTGKEVQLRTFFLPFTPSPFFLVERLAPTSRRPRLAQISPLCYLDWL